MKQARLFRDGQIVDAGDAAAHPPVCRKVPDLVTIGLEPLCVPVTPFVGKTHGDPVFRPCPQLFDQAVLISCCHLRVRNVSISACPDRNSVRFR